MDVHEHELQGLYSWVDEIPLSRPKKNIARDFSDGVLVAEVVHHFFPKLIELHNYSAANGTQQKLYNWNTLNQKALKKLGCVLSKADCEAVCNCQPGAIERVLKFLQIKIDKYLEGGSGSASPSGTLTPNLPPSASQLPTPMYASGPQAPPIMTQQHQPYQQPQRQAAGPVPNQAAAAAQSQALALAEKEQTIMELKETNEILETKVRKLEQLVRLKEAKIQTLMAKLQAAGMA